MTIEQLVAKYEAERLDVVNSASDYNESQVRLDYLDSFFELLGWDVRNSNNVNDRLRDVVIERTYKDGKKYHQRPDYTFQINGTKSFFCEAKKPSVNISSDNKTAFQTRSYGWTSQLGFSICFNFESLLIYDCHHEPNVRDSSTICLVKKFNYNDYSACWSEIESLLSYSSLLRGTSPLLLLGEKNKGSVGFDDSFLKFLDSWRLELSKDVVSRNRKIDIKTLNFYIQLLLNRILFLRICEERDHESFEQLKHVSNYLELKDLFVKSDLKYNSGIFELLEENWPFEFKISDELLIMLFSQLYYPNSSYSFSVMSPEILGSIYEEYLSKLIVNDNGRLSVLEKPEVRESGGVVSTPYWLAKKMVTDCIGSRISTLNIEQVLGLKIADICVGSGIFLISAFEVLCEMIVQKIIDKKDFTSKYITKRGDVFSASLFLKHYLATNNLIGIDIDEQAVEACRFSLLLKMIESEDSESLALFFSEHRLKALPSLSKTIFNGNSLVENSDFLKFKNKKFDSLYSVNPFDLGAFAAQLGGFDFIVGNPPYIRIQNMIKYAEEEVEFYQGKSSRYECVSGLFDKYFLFIERSISLIKPTGVICLITSNKFLSSQTGEQIRDFILKNAHLSQLVNFGHLSLFGKKTSVYSCIIEIDKMLGNDFSQYTYVDNLKNWLSDACNSQMVSTEELVSKTWMFAPPSIALIMGRIIEASGVTLLKNLADIFVGVQTSKDSIYIFKPAREDTDFYYFQVPEIGEVSIEREIVKPCLYDQEFARNSVLVPEANALMIFPYEIHNDKMTLIKEESFVTRFPRAWAYLNRFNEILSKRSIQPEKNSRWYQYGRKQSLDKFNGQRKIIWPVLSINPRYCIDEMNTFFTGGGNGPYYGLNLKEESAISLEYLCAILRFRCIDAFVMNHSSKFAGGYGSHGKQFVADLPIKNIDFTNKIECDAHTQITLLMRQHLEFSKSLCSSFGNNKILLEKQIGTIGEQIDMIISNLYNISRDDFNLINNFYYHGV